MLHLPEMSSSRLVMHYNYWCRCIAACLHLKRSSQWKHAGLRHGTTVSCWQKEQVVIHGRCVMLKSCMRFVFLVCIESIRLMITRELSLAATVASLLEMSIIDELSVAHTVQSKVCSST